MDFSHLEVFLCLVFFPDMHRPILVVQGDEVSKPSKGRTEDYCSTTTKLETLRISKT